MVKKHTRKALKEMNLDELQQLVGEKGLNKDEMIAKLLGKSKDEDEGEDE